MLSTLALALLLHASPPTAALAAVMEIRAASGSAGLATPIGPTLAVTALHVVEGGVDVGWTQGFTSGTARVVSSLKKRDIAILMVGEGQTFPFSVPIARDRIELFDEVFFISPDWEGVKGHLRGEVAFKHPDGRWAITSYGWFGMSGGGVFNKKGELIGVLIQISQGAAQRPGSAPFFSNALVVMSEVKGVR